MKKKLQEELRRVMGQLETLRNLPDPTAEQGTEIDNLLDQQERLLGEIRAAEARERRAAELEAQTRAAVNALPSPTPAPAANPGTRSIVIPATARRTTRHFDSPEQAFGFGQFIRASVFRNDRAQEWCRENGIAITRAQTESDNTAGGYLVPAEFGGIIDALIAQYGVIRQYATESVMSRDTKNHPKRPLLIRFRPGSELGAMTQDTARFGNIELTARKAYLLLQLSSELSEDAAISVADELAMLIAESAAYTEDDCGFNGTGGSTYFGIEGIFPKLMGISSNLSVVAAGSGIDTYAEVTRANLLTVKSRVPSAAIINGDAAWYCSNAALTNVFERLALEAGGATAAEVIAGAQPRFLGFPIRVTNAIVDTESDGAKALAFGSLRKGVVFGNRRELDILSSREAGFLTDSEYVRATERFDINIHEPGTSSAAGALVVLKFGA